MWHKWVPEPWANLPLGPQNPDSSYPRKKPTCWQSWFPAPPGPSTQARLTEWRDVAPVSSTPPTVVTNHSASSTENQRPLSQRLPLGLLGGMYPFQSDLRKGGRVVGSQGCYRGLRTRRVWGNPTELDHCSNAVEHKVATTATAEFREDKIFNCIRILGNQFYYKYFH